MGKLHLNRDRQNGSVILEALIAILIFSVGILALVGMQAITINNVSDAKYRADASFLADQIIGEMWAYRKSTTSASGVTSYGPDPSFACVSCTVSGGNGQTKLWAGLVGATGGVKRQLPQGQASIAVSGAQVTVAISWQPPQATTPHRQVTVAYIH